MDNKFMDKVAKELEYLLPIPKKPLQQPKNPCQQCQKLKEGKLCQPTI